MTAEEWDACLDTNEMGEVLRGKASARKKRLFDIACCRRAWHLLRKPEVREAILVGERYADGEATDEERRAALAVIHRARSGADSYSASGAALHGAGYSCASYWGDHALSALHDTFRALTAGASPEQEERERRAFADLIREVFGNPLAPVPFDGAWRTEAVVQLARAIYQDHDFAAMPVLADALEEAGCTERRILDHCRGLEQCPLCLGAGRKKVTLVSRPRGERPPLTEEEVVCVTCGGRGRCLRAAEHVRGCWMLDLILEKE